MPHDESHDEKVFFSYAKREKSILEFHFWGKETCGFMCHTKWNFFFPLKLSHSILFFVYARERFITFYRTEH